MLKTGAYFEGYLAYGDGLNYTDCPYVDADLARMWVAGYTDGFADALSQYGSF